MADAAAVRVLARRVQLLLGRAETETRALQALAQVDWQGPAARAYWRAAEDVVAQSLTTRRSLEQATATLQRHAAAVEEAEEQRRLVAARATSWAAAGLLGP